MFWVQALVLSQALDCALEPELRLPPVGAYRPLVLQKSTATKGMESWAGTLHGSPISVTRRLQDGAVGLVVAGRVVSLKAMGLAGVEGEGKIPFAAKGFKQAPIGFRIFRAALGYGSAEISIQATSGFYIAARCQGTLAMVPWDGAGPQAIDVNGDGRIDVNSPAEYSRGQASVFELNGKGFSIKGIDLPSRTLRLQPAEIGPRLAEGEVLPDISYVDRLKDQKLLSSHGDSYTLLDFWASWCAPCLAAFPQLKLLSEVHQLKVLGFSGDEDSATTSKTLAQFEVLWPDVQSTEPGWLMDYRLRVPLYPTYILLDPQRKIIFRTESTIELLEEIRLLVPKRKN